MEETEAMRSPLCRDTRVLCYFPHHIQLSEESLGERPRQMCSDMGAAFGECLKHHQKTASKNSRAKTKRVEMTTGHTYASPKRYLFSADEI